MKRFAFARRLLGLVALVCLLAPASDASAHAEPERADPPINGRVATAPAVLQIWFTEEVSPNDLAISVRAPDGSAADLGDVALDLFDPDRVRVTLSLRPNLPAGNYVVQWHTESGADGDAADGFFSFFVETGSAGASPVAASPVAASPVASAGGATRVASPIASPVAQVTPPAATDPTVTTTPVPVPVITGEEDFDSRGFGIAVVVGIAVAFALYLFWRLVRPKPGEIPPSS